MSSSHSLVDTSFSSRKKSVFFHSAITFSFGSIFPCRTKNIFPACGIFCKRIFEPIQPARRALFASGFLFSIISGTKKCFGITKKLTTDKLAKL